MRLNQTSTERSAAPSLRDNTILNQAFPVEDDDDTDYEPSDAESDNRGPDSSDDDSDKDTEWMELINPGRFPRLTSEYQYPAASSSSFDPSLAVQDAPSLYSDIKPHETPFLIAHLQSSEYGAPLTRTQYTSVQPLSAFALSRRLLKANQNQQQESSEDDSRRNCVICVSRPTIFWCMLTLN